MATARSQEPICSLVEYRTLELETEAGHIPVYNGVVVMEDKLLVIDRDECKLKLYNRHEGKLISTSHTLNSRPMHVCLIGKTEVAVCLMDGTIAIMSFKSIYEIKLVKRFKTGLYGCDSLAKLNSDKIVVSGMKYGIMCWVVLSITDEHWDLIHDICQGNRTHLTIKDNTVYISCWTDDFITNGVFAYDIYKPNGHKCRYQHDELKNPWSIMADRDCVYVCDRFSNTIHQLTDSCQIVTIHSVSSSPFGIFCDDQQGLLYTTSFESNVITVYKMESSHQTGMIFLDCGNSHTAGAEAIS